MQIRDILILKEIASRNGVDLIYDAEGAYLTNSQGGRARVSSKDEVFYLLISELEFQIRELKNKVTEHYLCQHISGETK